MTGGYAWPLALLAVTLGGIWLYWRVTRAAKAEAMIETKDAAIEAHEKMADAEAQAPRGREATVTRIREKGL